MAKRRNLKRRMRGSFNFLYKLLSMFLICAAIIAAITLFFRVKAIEISGQERYTEQEIRDVCGIQMEDNLFLLNKYEVAGSMREALPYIEEIRINRKLPSTIVIKVRECEEPLSLVQDDYTWLISPIGKIVDRVAVDEAEHYASISGCRLLAPTVGTQIAFATEHAERQEALMELIASLRETGMINQLDGIRLDDREVLRMDYAGRFTVTIPYQADFDYKLRFLREALNQDAIQDNMTGTFDMTRDDGRVNFIQNVR